MPDFRTAVARELERRKPRQVADPLRGHLVDRDAGMDVGAGRLLHPDAGQERAAGPGMIAGPVRPGGRVDLVESAQDLDMLLDLFQRLKRPGELEILAFLLGPPVALVHAVGNVDERHPQRSPRRRRRQLAGRIVHGSGRTGRNQRFKRREGQRNAHAPQECAAARLARSCRLPPVRFANGLCFMALTRA